MKLIDTILISAAVGFLLIGMDQMYKYGFSYSYWLFMVTIALFGIYTIRRGKRIAQDHAEAMEEKAQQRKERLRKKRKKRK